MIGFGALGQLAIAQLVSTAAPRDPRLSGTTSLVATALMVRYASAILLTDSSLRVEAGIPLHLFGTLRGNSSLNVNAFVFETNSVQIINGWYYDSKGGIQYYYRTADGRAIPRTRIVR